jgi:fido (protein-threonine AMPylation protein)
LPVAWNEDDPRDAVLIRANLRILLSQIVQAAIPRRSPSLEMAQDWHRRIYHNTHLPIPYYAGEFRNSDTKFPELYGYEVIIGTRPGVSSARVPGELRLFEESIQVAANRLDSIIPVDKKPADVAQLRSVLTLCAFAHGEWVRIHPFANGNGTTARLWANWSALRYGLPPFVRLKPRPEGIGYGQAARDSMRGDHRGMIIELALQLERRMRAS